MAAPSQGTTRHTPTDKPYTLYAWHLSYFAGKMRAYLVYKKVPFVEVPVSYRLLVGPDAVDLPDHAAPPHRRRAHRGLGR
jgi:hypothetical protein